ncbi:methylamine utilization protein MauJ [Desulfocurvibacter africanus]|uniref:methylamine utilization protein MauJ n=1 Tax=Desulfocurvibacter africanus TaxID=873 RepID=UPI002FD887AA
MPASHWATIGFDCDGSFESNTNIVKYEGYNLEVINGDKDTQHNIHINTSKQNYVDAHEKGRKFLSELSWLYGIQILYIFHYGGSSKVKAGKFKDVFNRKYNIITLEDYEQVTTNDKQRLALGFYREALASNSDMYSFLSFFKVFNINLKHGRAQVAWINDNISLLKKSKEKLEVLISEGVLNIGKHLYESGRCAIAHAHISSGAPVIDIDRIGDVNRINKELPIVRELAEIYITRELKIIQQHQVLKNKMMRCLNSIYKVCLIGLIAPSYLKNIARMHEVVLDVRILNSVYEFKTFSSIEFQLEFFGDFHAVLSNNLSNFPILFCFMVNFDRQTVSFKLDKYKLSMPEDRINKTMMLDYYHFLRSILLNGRIELLLTSDKSLFTRLDPFVAQNIHLDGSIAAIDAAINKINAKL